MNIFRLKFVRVMVIIIVILGAAITASVLFRDSVTNVVTDIADSITAGVFSTEDGAAFNGGSIQRYDFAEAEVAGDMEAPGEVIGSFHKDNITPTSGLLTGGEWRDNNHWSDWCELYKSRYDWNTYKDEWRILKDSRLTVQVLADGVPVAGAFVHCDNASAAVTDNKGMAYIFYDPEDFQGGSLDIELGGMTTSFPLEPNSSAITCSISTDQQFEKSLDLMIVCDTTGSMSDELSFLQSELSDVLSRIQKDNGNIPVNISVNFYRDNGDDYIVRDFPFTSDIETALKDLHAQTAEGGGDFPEAVDMALSNAIMEHDWGDTSTKIMFLVLDAPPHNDTQTVNQVNSLVELAASKGIRIIPVAASGIDKSTEYLLRTIAFRTGGTYMFLTDDSGIGNEHIEATVGAYNTEPLNDLMVRIVNEYLADPVNAYIPNVQTVESTTAEYIQ